MAITVVIPELLLLYSLINLCSNWFYSMTSMITLFHAETKANKQTTGGTSVSIRKCWPITVASRSKTQTVSFPSSTADGELEFHSGNGCRCVLFQYLCCPVCR
jgi:hypothetical protein